MAVFIERTPLLEDFFENIQMLDYPKEKIRLLINNEVSFCLNYNVRSFHVHFIHSLAQVQNARGQQFYKKIRSRVWECQAHRPRKVQYFQKGYRNVSQV